MMLYWQNEVGFALASLLFARCVLFGPRREAWFILTMAAFYVAAEWANIVAWGKGAGYVTELPVIMAVKGTFLTHFTGITFAVMLSVSCFHIADNSDPKSWVRWTYILLTGIKSTLGTSYAASLFDTNDLSAIHKFVEYYWFIPDMLVLLAGTSNPLSDRWQTK